MKKRCWDCKWEFGKCDDISYCGKVIDDGKPYSYPHWLPKNLLNEKGDCKYYKRKWWKFGRPK